jgi:hypothetical protein
VAVHLIVQKKPYENTITRSKSQAHETGLYDGAEDVAQRQRARLACTRSQIQSPALQKVNKQIDMMKKISFLLESYLPFSFEV